MYDLKILSRSSESITNEFGVVKVDFIQRSIWKEMKYVLQTLLTFSPVNTTIRGEDRIPYHDIRCCRSPENKIVLLIETAIFFVMFRKLICFSIGQMWDKSRNACRFEV